MLKASVACALTVEMKGSATKTSKCFHANWHFLRAAVVYYNFIQRIKNVTLSIIKVLFRDIYH